MKLFALLNLANDPASIVSAYIPNHGHVPLVFAQKKTLDKMFLKFKNNILRAKTDDVKLAIVEFSEGKVLEEL